MDHQIAGFKITSKSHNVATRAAESKRVTTVQNLQRSKAGNGVLLN
jgi:hypothetical protein